MRKNRYLLGGGALSLAAAFAIGYWVSGARAAGIPGTAPLTYSGILTDMNGAPITGQKNLLIQLFGQASGGTALCGSTAAMVTLVGGAFQVPLGDNCTAVVHSTPDLWVDVLVDGGPVGRAKLGAVPYAVEADTAQNAVAPAPNSTLAMALQTLQSGLQNLQANVSQIVCPAGFYRAGPNLCIESGGLHVGASMYTSGSTAGAESTCRALNAHVCTRTEMYQACAAVGTNGIPADFNPYGNVQPGWYGDRGILDNSFVTWNGTSCVDDNDAIGSDYTTVLPYRCCK
jgi:hypothetical protein